MRIREVSTGPTTSLTGKPVAGKAQIGGAGQKRFGESLDKAQSDRLDQRIALLLEDIEQQGKRLANSLNLKELLLYKSKVKGFMEEALGNMYRFSKNSVADRRGRHRIYSLVKRINRQLEELTEEMMSKQSDGLKILERVDNIRGLLIDLYT